MNQGTLRDGLISSPGGSRDNPASLFPMLESEKEWQTSVTSGRRCLELSESLNRPLSLAKMLLASSVWRMAKHLTGYFLTWKMKATPLNRLLFQLVPSERGTGETESGLLEEGFFLTPSTVQIEPSEERAGKRKEYRASVGRQDCPGSLAEQVARFFPTATTRDYKGGRKPETLEASGRNETNSLNDAVNAIEGHTGSLNPLWVEWLMGYPIGWTDLKDSETP